jgi:hypothetical protein
MLKPRKTPPKARPADADTPPPAPGLKPHPVLFRSVCVVFAVWIIILLVMYFLTVYPLRHPSH